MFCQTFVKKVLNCGAVFSKTKIFSYDIIVLEITCIEQIPDTRSACHKPKIPNILDGRLMVRSFSRKFQPTTDLGLRFEVVQSFRLVWTKQNVACHLPFSAFKSCAFYIRAFFYKIQTVHFSGALTWLTCHCQVIGTLGSALLNTGFCLCSYKRTYVLQARAPESQPLSSFCVTLWPS